MELKQIKELMAAMEKAGIKRLRIKDKEEYELELERKDEGHVSQVTMAAYPHADAHHKFPTHSTPPYRGHFPEEAPKAEEKKIDGKYITAPLVGTMYQATSPEDAPFVKVGDRVDENTVVCIIEAMKVMNEVKAGMSGTIAEIMATNAHPVEFGTKLFRIV
jgi:acetyl-CoA carboxylase biotin carboxyl carrier protein